jgi:hypothetical protein
MTLKDLESVVLFAALFTETALIALLIYRRVWRTLPLFFVYCIWDLSANVAFYVIQQTRPSILFHFFFAQTAFDSIFIFCVLVELAWSVLRPLRASLSRGALVIIAFLILLAGAAIWPFAALQGLAHTITREGQLFAQLQQTTSILRILFFLVLAGGSQLLSIGWRDRELQVATGFGLYSLVGLIAAVLNLHQTNAAQFERIANIVNAAGVCSLMYWVFSFAQQEAERRQFTPQMQRVLLAVAGAARATRIGLDDSQSAKSGNSVRR